LTPLTMVRPSSDSGAFSHTPFVVMWVATTVSLTGLAISDTSSAWLMTTLNPDPRALSLVQVASTLPMFLCTVPAGALADMVQARRFLITLETLVVLLMGLMGAVVYFDRLTPVFLLSTNFKPHLVAGFAGMAIYHAIARRPAGSRRSQRGQQRGLQP
jgi:MFS family permease